MTVFCETLQSYSPFYKQFFPARAELHEQIRVWNEWRFTDNKTTAQLSVKLVMELTHLSYDDCENTCTCCYYPDYHHQTYLPLFWIKSWKQWYAFYVFLYSNEVGSNSGFALERKTLLYQIQIIYSANSLWLPMHNNESIIGRCEIPRLPGQHISGSPTHMGVLWAMGIMQFNIT